MAEYNLSRQAEFDLISIFEFAEAKFGKYKADAYHAGFERSFGLLADFPEWAHRPMIWFLAFDASASNPILFSTPKKRDLF